MNDSAEDISRQQRWQDERLARGACMSCSQPAFGLKLCPECRQRKRDRDKARYRKKCEQRACACGKPADDGMKSCTKCRVNQRVGRSMHVLPTVRREALHDGKRAYHCGACGEDGHQRRTCTK